MQCDVAQVPDDKPFDAVVGRYILMFLPDPVAVLRSLSRVVRVGGIIAFQEPSWGDFLEQSARIPLWSAAASL
jgi:ubiquinone/menaquinone biosynthesis C-methylase UbiE